MKDDNEIVYLVVGRASNSFLFQELCSSYGASHQQLLFHSESRWLSRGKILARFVELRGEVETGETFRAWPRFHDEKWALLLSYLIDMMTALSALNESIQKECCTMTDFADKVGAFKEKWKLWYFKVKNKKFASFSILIRFTENLDPEPDLMTSVSFVILEYLHALKKNFEKYIPENINNYTWIKSIHRKCDRF